MRTATADRDQEPGSAALHTMKNKHAVILGRRGGKAGTGTSKARTTKQARKAAMIRWKKEGTRE